MRLALLIAAALPLAACSWERPPERKPINFYLADTRDLANVRRIMVLPFGVESGVNCDTTSLREAYITELAKLRRFEVVPLPADAAENSILNATIRTGRVSTEATVKLCNHYHLDGVLLGTVTSYRAYMPQHLGLRTQLLSVHSGAAVWAVDALYDANDQSTISDLRHYHDHVQASDGTIHGWEMNTLAPGKFATYVAHRCIGTWVDE
jgi:TolB-like protein